MIILLNFELDVHIVEKRLLIRMKGNVRSVKILSNVQFVGYK